MLITWLQIMVMISSGGDSNYISYMLNTHVSATPTSHRTLLTSDYHD
jgi:hypothetical protein